MMIENSSKGNYQAKQEDNDGGMKIEKFSKAASTSSRQWTAMRNPRIVRVSRSLGGKDRHSKVCTIRGLRDRRIRLSVPTAIQLYDLQDRLGLNQPSKVVDWLLEVTKSDIDKLPPLDFPQFFQQTVLPPHHHHEPAAGTSFSLGGFYHDTNLIKDMDYSVARLKGKEAESVFSKWWMKTNEQDQNQGGGGASNSLKLFQIATNNSSNANAMTYNSSSYYHMDVPSNLSLSQFGSHGNNLFPTSNMSVVPSCSQLLFCPSSATPTPPSLSSLFTPHAPFMSNNSMESTDIPRQSNHFQFLSSSSSQLNMPHVFNSPLGQRHSIITPFSSKLLDSDNHNNRSQPEDMDSARS